MNNDPKSNDRDARRAAPDAKTNQGTSAGAPPRLAAGAASTTLPAADGDRPSLLPAITAPQGGGAIRGIGEKFSVNAATGTAGLSVPLPLSPARSGFGPQLSLAYDSGAGNGPFGLGFTLSVPTITRKTDKGLPRYLDDDASDTFILSGAEDLVPLLDPATHLPVEVDRGDYTARRYRPRVEGLFARIERWKHRTTRDEHWRVTTKDNTTHIYGTSGDSRLVDPADPLRVFSWLLEESRDDKGNVVRYEYKPEDGEGVDRTQLSEASRFTLEGSAWRFTATAQRYLKRVRYCNATPFDASDFLMELVFDYGEHPTDPAAITPTNNAPWPVRPDAFSSYRVGFELRTYRLCQRVLMFHRFSADRAPLLVRSTNFTHDPGPAFTYLTGITQIGYLLDNSTWQGAALPTLQLDFTRPVLHDELRSLPRDSLDGLEGGVDGAVKQWVDLDGEGLPGVLIDAGTAWYYKPNRGDGHLQPPRVLTSMPSPASLSGGVQQLEDIDGDGRLELVSYQKPLAGYFSRTADGTFEPLRYFESLPHVDWSEPNLRFIDLDGDGHADLLITEHHAFLWYRSQAKEGFDPAERLFVPSDERRGPAIVFADAEQTIHLADMSGDGLIDIVRIRNGEVCYWPNLGHGRFGAKITLEDSPVFTTADHFDARRVRFADVDGSGTSDLFYLGPRYTTLYLNQSGNQLSPGVVIRSLPPVDNLSQLGLVDLLGQGTACLVWSSPLTSAPHAILYIDLLGGIKPHLLATVTNNLGAETHIQYAPSTRFYLADKAAGHDWLTRLAFPVHVVERTEHRDAISNSRLVSTYSYHHGYFDGHEREFRGFARVEQRDAETFSEGDPHTELHQPPTRTVTWYHTGAWLEKERLERALQSEYSRHSPARLAHGAVLPAGLSIQDEREAARALRGSLLRQEAYADDGTDRAEIPYVVTEQSHTVLLLQSSAHARHGVFFSHPRESVSVHTERNTTAPRVTHELILHVDDHGNITRQAAIAYGRAPALAAHPDQSRAWATLTEAAFINRATESDWYRVGINYEQRLFELTDLPLPTGDQSLISFTDLEAALSDPTTQRRLLDHRQQLFYSNALSGPLPLGSVESLALPYETHQLALTPDHVAQLVTDSATLSGTAFDPALLVTEGRYLQRADGYWAPSGRVLFDATRFYLPIEAIDPFGAHSFVEYDAYSLLITSTRDALGNITAADHNYRVLAPSLVTDANLNRTAFAFDALGLLTYTAVMGKPTESLGDDLTRPTTELRYDVLRYQREQRPTVVHTLARERHLHDLPDSPVHESFTYSDGFGRVIQQKVQAEPGDAPLRNADGTLQRDASGALIIGPVELRWVGTGRTVFNNKGNPVKQYEPFFSATSDYEDEPDLVDWGVTPLIHYDPLDRVIRTDLPNGTLSRVVFTPWYHEDWDANDTVRESSWWQERGSPEPSAPQPSDPEQRAAWLAAHHANTPTRNHFDALGRPFLVQTDNGPDPANPAGHLLYNTQSQLDIEGNLLGITDSLGIRTIAQAFDVLGRRYRVQSPDAGTRLAVADVAGKPLRSWDSRGHTFRSTYDELQRPTHHYVHEGTSERLITRTVYGESLPLVDAQTRNLRGRAHLVFDGAGLVVSDRFDFKGNLLEARRRIATAYQTTPDWSALPGPGIAATLEAEAVTVGLLQSADNFTTRTEFDALNRVTARETPDGSITRPTYNQAGLLEAVSVHVRGAPDLTSLVTDLEYNAKGQRTLCEYANGTTTTYAYDPNTFRLVLLETRRASPDATLQRLLYTHDPVGNIVALRDRSNWNPNLTESGDGDYVYDALYRLLSATGREHPVTQPDHHNSPHASDLQALQRYLELYQYDAVGNILEMRHRAGSSNQDGWTRRYLYAHQLPELPDRPRSNRLLSSTLPGFEDDLTVRYTYDAHGSMTSMPHLPDMDWDHADRLQHANQLGGGDVYFTYDASGQRVRKVWLHGSTVEERIYLGAYEVYRRQVGVNLDLERETLHVTDDQRRIALLETATYEDGSPVPSPTTRFRYQLDNHLGSAMLELDDDGNVISYEEYHPYGSTAFHTAPGGAEVSAKRYRYTGKERDEETGLYYHGARYYAPWLARWTAADPLALAAPGGADPNVFAYVGGRPIGSNDPTGHQEASLVGPPPKRPGARHDEPVGLQVLGAGPDYAGMQVSADPNAVEKLAAQTEPIPEVIPLEIVERSSPSTPQPEVTLEALDRAEAQALADIASIEPVDLGFGSGPSVGTSPGMQLGGPSQGPSPGEQVLMLMGTVALGAAAAYGVGLLAGAFPLVGLGLAGYGAYQLVTNFSEIKESFLSDPYFAAFFIGGTVTGAGGLGAAHGRAAAATVPEDALLSTIGPRGLGPRLATEAAKNVKFTREMNSSAEVIARGSRIDKVETLITLFGGKARDWSKMKTWDSSGREIHYYTGPGGRKVGIKFAGEHDPF